MKSPQITAIGFDLGGVMITSNQAELYEYIAGVLGTDTVALATAIDNHRDDLEGGRIGIIKFWNRICKELGVKSPYPKLLKGLWTHGFLKQTKKRPELIELVERLKANGYKVGMFTNISRPVDRLDRGRCIFDHFEVVLKSYKIGEVKPRPGAYQALATALATPVDQLVFIDDLPSNVQGANAAGVHGIQFTSSDRLIADLQALGIKTD